MQILSMAKEGKSGFMLCNTRFCRVFMIKFDNFSNVINWYLVFLGIFYLLGLPKPKSSGISYSEVGSGG